MIEEESAPVYGCFFSGKMSHHHRHHHCPPLPPASLNVFQWSPQSMPSLMFTPPAARLDWEAGLPPPSPGLKSPPATPSRFSELPANRTSLLAE